MIYTKKFIHHSDYDVYINGQNKILPNVSYCDDNNEVHYNPWYDPERFVAKFNITDITTPIYLFNNPNLLKEIEIDGVVQPNIVTSYQFNTLGIHTVKYTLVDGTTSIDGSSFAGRSNMISITIPDTITSILAAAFAGCISLRSISIPNSVTTIGGNSSNVYGIPFGGCSGLTNVTIPNSVTTIGEGAFGGTNFNFEDVIFESINPNATFVVDTINKCITNIDGTVLLVAFNNTVAIPNTVTSIGQYAFSGCMNLTSVTIPNSVISIGTYAFTNCSNLTSITSLATTAPTIQSTTFDSVKTGGTLYVPTGSTRYDTWMGTSNYYLGKYNWTKVEQ